MEFIPDQSSTFWKVGRLKLFDQWPFQSSDDICIPERMAAAGFFPVGGKAEPDLVECFICKKQLDDWDPHDDPWAEHVKHQPRCPFVELNKQDEALWTIENLFDLLKKYMVKECTREMEIAKTTATNEGMQLVNEIPQIFERSRKMSKDRG